jgi:hypothetical protein
MNILQCASTNRREEPAYVANKTLIWNDDSTRIFNTNEKRSNDGSSESACYYVCEYYTGRMTLVGNASSDPVNIPNCLVKRIKTGNMLGAERKTVYIIYAKGVSNKAVSALTFTEQALNWQVMKNWDEFLKSKLYFIRTSYGYLELSGWVFAYKAMLDLDWKKMYMLSLS